MNINYIEIIGWLGFAFISYGYYLNAKKKNHCFYVWAVGNFLFLIYSTLIGSFPMFTMSFFTLGMNFFGWIKWKES